MLLVISIHCKLLTTGTGVQKSAQASLHSLNVLRVSFKDCCKRGEARTDKNWRDETVIDASNYTSIV